VISDKLRKRKTPILAFFGLFFIALATTVLMPAGSVIIYAVLWATMNIGNSIWVIYFSMVGEVLPARRATIGLGLLNGFNIIFSSLMTPLYGSLVDQLGSFFIPSLISVGVALATYAVLIVNTKETYGNVVRE